jgi:hypothetical protein
MHPLDNFLPNAFDNLRPIISDLVFPTPYVASPIQKPLFTFVQPCEKSIKKNCDFDQQLTKVDATTITLRPNNSFEICQTEEWDFPCISFTVQELRKYLEEHLKVEGWFIGGAANPACLPYNDIDLGFYIPGANYPYIDKTILEFIRKKLIEKQKEHPSYYPVDKDWVLYKVFYTGRSIFKNHAGSFYGLQQLQIKIFDSPQFHCISPGDGAQASPSRRVLRFAMGEGFALTNEEFHKALSSCHHKIYDVLHVEGHRDLLFRLIFKTTTGHKVRQELFDAAIQQMQAQLQNEHVEGMSKGFTKRQFSSILSKQNSKTLTQIDLLATKLKNHQTNHYLGMMGKLIDFLNFMHILSMESQKDFAQAWLDKAEILGLKKMRVFAELIIRYPGITAPLLAFMRGVFLCEWAHQIEGQNGRMFAYQRRLPPIKEVINDSSLQTEMESKEQQEHPMHIALKEGDHAYFLLLPEVSSPVQIAKDFFDSLPILQDISKKIFPAKGLGILKEAFVSMNFDPEYVCRDSGSFIEKRLLTVFDAPHVKEVLQIQFKNLHDPRMVLSLLGGRLEQKDRDIHSLKMAVASIDQCRVHGERLIIFELKNCCELIMKYSDAGHLKPSIRDLELLSHLPEHILCNEKLRLAGIGSFFKSNFSYLFPHIFRSFLSEPNPMIIEKLQSFYESGIRLGLLTAAQEEALLMDLLKVMDRLPISKNRLKIEWGSRLAITALEKGIISDSKILVNELRKLIKLNNPRYLLYVHRYLNTLFRRKDVEKHALCDFLQDLLHISIEYEWPELDKQCFSTLLKLHRSNASLFSQFINENGFKIFEKLTNAAEKLLSVQNIEREIFEAFVLTISALKLKGDVQSIHQAFKILMQHKSTALSLNQIAECAKIGLWLLQKSSKIDQTTKIQWLDRLVLPLLGATNLLAASISFKDVGKELLEHLLLGNADPEWIGTVKQRLMLRIASAVSKQKAIIRAQEHLETFTNILITLTDKNKWKVSNHLNKFQSLLKGDFQTGQSSRVQLLLKAVQEIDISLVKHEMFMQLEKQFGMEESERKTLLAKELSPGDICRASDELYAISLTPNANRITRTNSLCHFIIDSLHSLSANQKLGKENEEKLNKSLFQTIKGLASNPNINAVRIAKELFNHSSIIKLWNSRQRGTLLLELLKGHVIIEKLYSNMDFSKDLKQFLSEIIRILPLTEEVLGMEGCMALLRTAEQMQKGTVEDFNQILLLLSGLCQSPALSYNLRKKVILFSCKFVLNCLAQNKIECCSMALKLLGELVKNNLISVPETSLDVDHCIVKLCEHSMIISRKDEGCDKDLEEFLSIIQRHKLYSFSKKVRITLQKALLCTGRKTLRDWILKLMPGWDKSLFEQAMAYEEFMLCLYHICEQEENLAVFIHAANLLKDHYQAASKILMLSGKKQIVNDCFISIYSRLQDKKRLLMACTTLIKEGANNKGKAICFILKGFSKFPVDSYDIELINKLNDIIKICTGNIPTLPQSEIETITKSFIELFDFAIKNKISVIYKNISQNFIKYLKAIKIFNKQIVDGRKIGEQFLLISLLASADFRDILITLMPILDIDDLDGIKFEMQSQLKKIHEEIMSFKPSSISRESLLANNENKLLLVRELNNIYYKIFDVMPTYSCIDPELGRQAFEFFIKTASSYPVREVNDQIFDLLKLCDEVGIYEFKKIGLCDAVPITKEETVPFQERYLKLLTEILKYYLEINDRRQERLPYLDTYSLKYCELICAGKHYKFHDELLTITVGVSLIHYGKTLITGDAGPLNNYLCKLEEQINLQFRQGDWTVIKKLLTFYTQNAHGFSFLPIWLKRFADADKKLRNAPFSSIKCMQESSHAMALFASIKISKDPVFEIFQRVLDVSVMTNQLKFLLNIFKTQEEFDHAISYETLKLCSSLSLQSFDKFICHAIQCEDFDPNIKVNIENDLLRAFKIVLKPDDFKNYQLAHQNLTLKTTDLLKEKLLAVTAQIISKKRPEQKADTKISIEAKPSKKSGNKKHKRKNKKN